MGYRNSISGIYTITNLINDKKYVGYSCNILQRINKHLRALLDNKHINAYLQKAFNKYGENNFKFETLVECPIEFLASEEHYWANLLNVHNDKFGYNIEPTNPENRKIVSKQSRIKISNAIKGRYIGRKMSKEWIDKGAMTRTGKKATLSHRNNISKALIGRKLSEEHILKIKKRISGSKLNDKHKFRCKQNSVTRKPVLQFDSEGKFIKEWLSIKEASLELNISRYTITKIAGGKQFKRNLKKRYLWKYN